MEDWKTKYTVGSQWRMRDGREIIIKTIMHGLPWPITAYVGHEMFMFNEQGKYSMEKDVPNHPYDLITRVDVHRQLQVGDFIKCSTWTDSNRNYEIMFIVGESHYICSSGWVIPQSTAVLVKAKPADNLAKLDAELSLENGSLAERLFAAKDGELVSCTAEEMESMGHEKKAGYVARGPSGLEMKCIGYADETIYANKNPKKFIAQPNPGVLPSSRSIFAAPVKWPDLKVMAVQVNQCACCKGYNQVPKLNLKNETSLIPCPECQ